MHPTPAPYTEDELMAVRALFDGKANEGQQITAMAFILFKVCKVDQLEFGGERTHMTSLNQGLRFAGLQIAGLRKPEALAALKAKQPKPKPSERQTSDD